MIILDTLETCPTSVMTTQDILARELDSWMISYPWGKYLHVNTNVTIEEKAYFTPPLGSTRSFRISFSDTFPFELLFYVKKKSKSLKHLGAAAVFANINTEEDIVKLGIPHSILVIQLASEFNDVWSTKFYRNNIKSGDPHSEASDVPVLSSRSVPFLNRSPWIHQKYENNKRKYENNKRKHENNKRKYENINQQQNKKRKIEAEN